MNLTRVWDAPVRIFHWCFAAGFLVAYAMANLTDENSVLFASHAVIGYGIAGLVMFRVLWLFAGTKWSRLSGLALSPKDLSRYVRGVFAKDQGAHVGHNPATSWTLLAMLACAAGLAWTGWQMSVGSGISEDLHALFANGLFGLALLHVAGVLLHSLRHCDGLVLSMIHGHKRLDMEPSVPSRGGVAVLLVAGLAIGAVVVKTSYEPTTGTLRIPGTGRSFSVAKGESRGDHSLEHEEDDHD